MKSFRSKRFALSLVMFCAPIFLFDYFYVRSTSPSIIEFRNVEKEFSLQVGQANILILGNSIPRRWHPWLGSNENPHIIKGKNDRILNLALGGAPPSDWACLLEKALLSAPNVKRIYAVGNEYYFHTGLHSSSYLPLAISFREILKRAWLKGASLDELSYLFQAKLFATVGFRRELLFRFFSGMIPGYESISGSMEFARQELNAADPESSQKERLSVFHSMAELAHKAKARLVFILAPVGPWGEERRELAKSNFHDVCRAGNLECLDLSDAFPMSSFDPDKTHLTETESRRLLRIVLERGSENQK